MPSQYGKLFLIPNYLAPDNPADFLAAMVSRSAHHIRRFVVENEKEARQLIKKLQLSTPQNELELRMWNEHSTQKDLIGILELFEGGNDVGLISDAGLPCVADPGADVVKMAHGKRIEVVPLPGASSILMALMGSGMNGQGFTFHGYLPIDRVARVKKIKELESAVQSHKQSQIFMEAPYRNNHLLEDVLKHCGADTRLCIAANVSAENAMLRTKTIREWRQAVPELHKIPTIFILG